MRELVFLVSGVGKDDARRLRGRRSGRGPARGVGWALLGVFLLYLLTGLRGQLEITSPPIGTRTLDAQIAVTGTATDIQADAVTLEVNGSPQTVPISNGLFEAQVSLVLGDNAIRATANDISSETRTIIRSSLPLLTIDSPPGNTHTTAAEIDVTGTVENSDDRAVTLEVNGTAQSVPIHDGRFSSRVRLVPGANVIRALVTRGSSAAIEVMLESGVAIASPPDGHETDSETVTVIGTVENTEARVITLSSNEFSRNVPLQNGNFTYEVALKLGENRIKASLGAASDEIIVHRKLPPVIITLTSPQSGVTESAVASVRGTIENPRGGTITLRVNGTSRALRVTGGRFAAEVPLKIGYNHIQASQDDSVSNEAVVNRQQPPTQIRITSPVTGTTKAPSVRVMGTVANQRGDTITLTINGSSRSLPITNGGFTSTVDLVYGDTRIQATQGDAVSNEVFVSRPEPLPTLISITSPVSGSIKDSSVTVNGTIANPRGDMLTLTVNGQPRSVRIINGGFASGVKLAYGDTRIQARQGDAVSNEVILTLIPPRTSISINSPKSGPTKASSVRVSGTITNSRGYTLTLTVNGSSETVQISDGSSFAWVVKLGYGDTTIQASQGDAWSNQVVVTRAEPPPRTSISINSPKSGPTKASSVRVSGTITNPRGDTLTLTVNGSSETVQITDGSSFAWVVKLGYGDTTIQASQGDAWSNQVVVTRAEPPPRTSISINSPKSGPTKASSVRVSGTITNSRGYTLTLTVNGSSETVQITDGRSFASVVKLGYGDTTIQASQGDAWSNQVIVTRAEPPPRTSISINSPKSGPIKASSVRVSGTITNSRGYTLTLTVNGSSETVQITDGSSFASSVKLGYGDTTIQASQGDAVSNKVVVSRVGQTDADGPQGPSECSKINCDCENVRSPLIIIGTASAGAVASDSESSPFSASSVGGQTKRPPRDRQTQCREAEARLKKECGATGKVEGSCPLNASGPKAWPKPTDKKKAGFASGKVFVKEKEGVKKP